MKLTCLIYLSMGHPIWIPIGAIVLGLAAGFCVIWNQQCGAQRWSEGWRIGLGFVILLLSFLLIAYGVSEVL